MDECLIGSVEIWPLLDVLGWLHRARRSASVQMGSARVIVWDGQVVYARWSQLQGEQALLALCGLRRAYYSIAPGTPATFECNVVRATEALLFNHLVAASPDDARRRTA